jgi:hypothetical protein
MIVKRLTMKSKGIILVFVLCMVGGITAGWGQTKKLSFPEIDWQSGWSGGFKVGTLGPGIEAIKSVNTNWNARLGFNLLPFTINRQTSVNDLGLNIKSKNRLGGINLQGDFLFKPWFYFTGGLMVDLIHSKISINLTDTVEYGDITIDPVLVGDLTVRARPGWIVAPFLGIGLRNAMSVDKKFWFNLELGAIYHGKPHFRLDAEGMINPTASAENEKALENIFKGYRFYPLLSAQINYRIR